MIIHLLIIEFLYYSIFCLIFFIITKYIENIRICTILNKNKILLFSYMFGYIISFINNVCILEFIFFAIFGYFFYGTILCCLFIILFFLFNFITNFPIKIIKLFLKKIIKKDIDIKNFEIKTGIDYENYVANLLKKYNFKVQTTPKTGDFGVDLIAEKDKLKIAIQCKYYSRPVGIKAVQEVISGMKFYDCEVGCVISNNVFTKNAKKLANNQNILLLNEKNISNTTFYNNHNHIN